jgi:DNA-binding LacI/PurR family transcriptional regulator
MTMPGTAASGGDRRQIGGTSYDVARRAGVSQSAVSRCFRPGASVAPTTRARIIAAANELGYRPNAIAQSLITRRSGMVAVIISNLTNLYYPEVLAELTQRLSERGARVLLFALQAESDIDSVLDQVWRYQVDGAIVAARLSSAQLLAFERRGTALVLYNRASEETPVASVSCEFAAGELLLVDGMVASGCTRFGIIGGPEDSSVGEARVKGARDRLASAGLTNVPIDRGDFSYNGGYEATHRLLARHKLDAIIAANDVMALGAMDAARLDLGLAVPDDLAIVGFDGVAPAMWRSYNLTTVRQPVGRMTAAAIAMLFERIENPHLGPERRLFSGDLIPGNTARLSK